MRELTRYGVVVVLAAVLLAGLSGCSQPDAPAVDSVAREFRSTAADGDTARACSLLAPGTRAELEQSAGRPCPQALGPEVRPAAGRVRGTQVFGTMAKVAFEHDTVFLAEYRGGWKVLAAACTRVPGHPYDCHLQGG